MKPPLMRLRIGELYGRKTTVQDSVDLSGKNDVLGFIKSLSYSVPDNSPWEIEKGKMVPKYIDITFGFQVIHSNVPSLKYAKADNEQKDTFYGITQKLFDTK